MKSVLSKLLVITMLVMLFQSCREPYREFYRSELLGSWESISYVDNNREYSIPYGEYEVFSFYDNGTGRFIDEFGHRTDFYWTEYGRSEVEIRYFTGEIVRAFYDFSRGDLLMTTDASWRHYTVYRYTNAYL